MVHKIEREFSLNSKTYAVFNIIQRNVAEKLFDLITDKPESILDIGCGDGLVYSSITWPIKNFVGIDFAQGMLNAHPANDNVKLLKRDFNHSDCFKNLQIPHPYRVISSSALQWADNLEKVFQTISKLNAAVSLAIFTSGTFNTLYQTASIPVILPSSEDIIKTATNYFDAQYEVINYKLSFPSVREMFIYMKKSGVSGSRNILSYSQMKELMHNYPLNYLEFEIVLIHEKSCTRE